MSDFLQGAVNQGKAGSDPWKVTEAAITNGTQLTKLTDEYGFLAEMTPMGEVRTVSPFRLVGSTFSGNILDPNFWTAALGTGGSISQGSSQVVLSTGTTANNGVSLTSVRIARYVSGTSNRFRGVIQLADTGTLNNTRRWGAFNTTDGAFFELSGTTFKVVTRKGSVDTAVVSGGFNGTLGASYAPTTDATTFEIYWTNSKIFFVIGDEILHTVSALSATWSASINLPVRLENQNSGGSVSNVSMSCRVAAISRFGPSSTQPTSKYQAGTTTGIILKYGTGNLHGVVISGVNNNSVVNLYDNTAASGTLLWSSGAMGALTTPFALEMHDVPFFTGLTLEITGANSNVFVAYE